MVRESLRGALPSDFTGFYVLRHKVYLRYAYLQLGDKDEAIDAVEEVFVQLATVWRDVLAQPSVEAYAFAALKEEVSRRLQDRQRPMALVETAAFAEVRRRTRARLEVLESRLGLFAAIARLPERHFDVVLLHYVMERTQQDAARIMGISYPTVRSHLRGARRRLAKDLGITWSDAPEDSTQEER
ncbi:RNA polymerase sigma factor [Streptomyces durbertensis]|uniref:RNA polymerase sigma factor n=1 Tax=Streptomyces durbertensis TaxID=2448886 RepID=UPI002B2061AC|nr:sigma-70 family RNA polymerase sigma factor [Streptomyces durbertensis]